MTTTNNATNPIVWMSESGTVVCTTHAYPFLRREIDAHPDDGIIFTAWDSWVRVYEDDARKLGHSCLACIVAAVRAASDDRRTTSAWTLTNSSDSETPQPPRTASITPR